MTHTTVIQPYSVNIALMMMIMTKDRERVREDMKIKRNEAFLEYPQQWGGFGLSYIIIIDI